MDEAIHITIDGRRAEARAGETILTVARRLGIEIPTLCHHESLAPYAACRVCLVEAEINGRTDLVPSCQYPACEGLTVSTNSPAVVDARRVVLELLLARCPASEVVRDLAARFGVTETPYPSDDPDQTCILCGLCVRACAQQIGAAAIGFARRGIDRTVGTPFDAASDACIGCMACVEVCPTGHIRSIDDGPLRRMETWHTELQLAPCPACGRPFAPVKQLAELAQRLGEWPEGENICPQCRRGRTAERLAEASKLTAAMDKSSL